jgi:predicted N-acetyltransferase YhbS
MATPSGDLPVENLPFDSASPALRREIVILQNLVWPSKDQSLEQRIEKARAEKTPNSDVKSQVIWHVVRDNGVLLAICQSFRRVVATESGQRFPVLALASVVAHPEFRGRGHAKAVVCTAWARLTPEIPVSFFQTGVSAFYERMGARCVSNRIYDSTGADCAFWEPHAVIYPANAPWPSEPIDLLGRGW